MTRNEIQNKALELSRKHKHILLEWATGVGKSKAAMDIASEYTDGYDDWLLVCKETNHIENWKLEFEKHGYADFWNNYVVAICYASLHKFEGDYKNLILDEVHATSDLRTDILKTIKADKIISLSATVPAEVKKRLNEIEPFHNYKITTTEAIEWGILPEPVINIVGIDLDKTLKRNKVTISGKKRIMTDQQYYTHLTERVNYWSYRYNSSYEEWMKIRMLRAGLDRKKFIASCKTEKAEEIIKELKDKRFICFSNTIEQSKSLGANSNIVNSKVPLDKRQLIIDAFNAEQISQLHAVNMLRESMNLNNIHAGIIVQLDDQEKSAIQSIGRVLRSIAPEIYILVVKNTKDEQFLENALKSIDKKYIKHIK